MPDMTRLNGLVDMAVVNPTISEHLAAPRRFYRENFMRVHHSPPSWNNNLAP